MKRKLCLILSCILVLVAIIPTFVFASDVSLFNNNTSRNYTSFTITDSGEARVAYKYEGYEGITTGAEITIKIEKRNLTVLRIPNGEINQNFEGVCKFIDIFVKESLRQPSADTSL